MTFILQTFNCFAVIQLGGGQFEWDVSMRVIVTVQWARCHILYVFGPRFFSNGSDDLYKCCSLLVCSLIVLFS